MKRPKPKELKNIDITPVIELCEKQMDLLEAQMCSVSDVLDGEQHIYRSIMETIYGEDVSDWIRGHIIGWW